MGTKVIRPFQIMAILGIFLLSRNVGACSLAANYKFPTFKDNISMAEKILIGHVQARESTSDGGFKIQIRVEKIWKGKAEGTVSFNARAGSTCDGFGLTANPGHLCILFLTADDLAITGIFNGNPSLCVPADSPQAKNFVAKYDRLFKKNGIR